MLKAKELKELIAPLDDETNIVIRIKPAMSSLDEGHVGLENVEYVELVYYVASRMTRPEMGKHATKQK